MQLRFSPSMRSITISSSSNNSNNNSNSNSSCCKNGEGFNESMKIKLASRHVSYRTLFHTILVLAFLLPFVFILTTLVTLEGVNKCSSFDCLGRRFGPKFLSRVDNSARLVKDFHKILSQASADEIPNSLKLPGSFSQLVSEMKTKKYSAKDFALILKGMIYAVSITIRIVLGFMLLALIWKFDFPPFMVLIIAILNDGTIMTISKDRVKPSPMPDSWKLGEIFITGIILGSYLAMMTVIFFWAAYDTNFFPRVFGVSSLQKNAHDDFRKLASAIYLQVSIISQALIFVTRSRSWSYFERPGLWLLGAFAIAQLIATLIAVYANWAFAAIEGIGWGWAGVIWLYNIVCYIPLDFIKFTIPYAMSGKAWDLVIERRTNFTRKRGFGKEDRELKWAQSQRTLHGLHSPESNMMLFDRTAYPETNPMAEDARRRAEITRLRELHTLKGHMESAFKLKGLDLDNHPQSYTV